MLLWYHKYGCQKVFIFLVWMYWFYNDFFFLKTLFRVVKMLLSSFDTSKDRSWDLVGTLIEDFSEILIIFGPKTKKSKFLKLLRMSSLRIVFLLSMIYHWLLIWYNTSLWPTQNRNRYFTAKSLDFFYYVVTISAITNIMV